MKEELILPYELKTFENEFKEGEYLGENLKGKPLFVFIPCNTTCTLDLKVALGFAFSEPYPQLKPVLFIISCLNYY